MNELEVTTPVVKLTNISIDSNTRNLTLEFEGFDNLTPFPISDEDMNKILEFYTKEYK